jgi:hypothetical protein
MSDNVRIHGERSIELGIEVGDTRGLIFVDSYWGSHAKLYSFLIDTNAKDSLVTAYVPNSDVSLMVDRACDMEDCNSDKAIQLSLPGGRNKIFVCARLGCPGHHLDVPDMPAPVSDTVSHINFFGQGRVDEGWFDQV